MGNNIGSFQKWEGRRVQSLRLPDRTLRSCLVLEKPQREGMGGDAAAARAVGCWRPKDPDAASS